MTIKKPSAINQPDLGHLIRDLRLLAGQIVTWWENPTPDPGAMRDLIQTEILPSLHLAESDSQHQLLETLYVKQFLRIY